ncbi:hypothetical protein BRD22_11245 [Halobacteriales archaeon SW_8_68_21]|nr:MAG: hypothetical protein BRD22_11245 [Halobacteriales archaeon SW_8_68_21]
MEPKYDGKQLRDLVHKRYDILECINKSQKDIPTIVTNTKFSRTTVDRSVKTLIKHDLIQETEDRKYKLTSKGELIKDETKEFHILTDSIASATDLISYLNQPEQIPPYIFRDASINMANPKAPEACLRPIIQLLEEATYFCATSRVAMTYGLDKLYDIANKKEMKVEICVGKEVMNFSSKLYKEKMKKLCQANHIEIYSTSNAVPHSLWIVETPSNTKGGFVVHSDGAVKGILSNDSSQAVDWIEMLYNSIQDESELITESAIRCI